MDTFEDPEWGNSTVFSYYKFPGTTEFKVSASLLETSLKRVKTKKSKIDSETGQEKEKRKHSEEETEEANTLQKNKKPKRLKEKESEVVDGKVSKGQQSSTSNTSESNKKSNVKKLSKKNSDNVKSLDNKTNSDNVTSLDDTEDHVVPASIPVKKKNKNANKRNKYKELNTGKKKKNATLVNGEFQEQPSHHEVVNVNNTVCSENVTNKGASEILETTYKPLLNSPKLNPDKGDKDILEKADGKIKPKSQKRKKRKSTLSSDQMDASVNPGVESGNCSTNMTSKKKGKKTSKSIMKDSKISKKVNLDNKKGKQRKLSDESEEKKTKINGDKKKNKYSKDSGICKNQVALGDKEPKDADDEEVDSKLREDLEEYLNELNFSNVNNGIAYDTESSGSMETSLLGNISDSDSEDEYIEDEAQEETSISSEKKVAGKEKASKSNRDKSKVITLSKESKSLAASGKNNEKPSRPLNPTSSKNEGAKFDKDILSRMLKDSGEKGTKAASGNPALSAAEELREKMKNQLNAARFRLVNEQMYTATSSEAAKLFKSDPNSFEAYHTGFKAQVARWPVNPLDKIIKWLKKKPNTLTVADFGCGEAVLAASVPQKEVHSFDLVALNPRVTVCDMAHTPLQSKSVDVAVFCLSLMGTNIKDFLLEASRVLKKGGILKIAEVESRISNTKLIMAQIEKYGFKCTYSDTSTKYFYMFDFKKCFNVNKKDVPNVILKPCKYKKR